MEIHQSIKSSKEGYNNIPVVVSAIRRMAVIKPNQKIATAKTERMGHLLISGAMRKAPIH